MSEPQTEAFEVLDLFDSSASLVKGDFLELTREQLSSDQPEARTPGGVVVYLPVSEPTNHPGIQEQPSFHLRHAG